MAKAALPELSPEARDALAENGIVLTEPREAFLLGQLQREEKAGHDREEAEKRALGRLGEILQEPEPAPEATAQEAAGEPSAAAWGAFVVGGLILLQWLQVAARGR